MERFVRNKVNFASDTRFASSIFTHLFSDDYILNHWWPTKTLKKNVKRFPPCFVNFFMDLAERLVGERQAKGGINWIYDHDDLSATIATNMGHHRYAVRVARGIVIPEKGKRKRYA